MRKILIFAVLLITGCTSSTGIVRDGSNSYRVMATGDTGFTNSGTLQKNAYREAGSFCAKENKIVETVNMDSKQSRPFGGWPEATLIFKCVDPSKK